MKDLINIQSELKAPKGQYNSFGKYKYRSAEDILEAVKPLCAKYECELTLYDEIVQIGDRYYIKATAKIEKDGTTPVCVTAYAREDESKKGMDGSQVTGSASSYARKYALNGLFLIDDTKDSDSNEQRYQAEAADKKTKSLSRKELEDKIVALCDIKRLRVSDVCNKAGVTELSELNEDRLQGCLDWLNTK
jgi:hypothetical protein|uniref:ERF superfamily protein n=1 Tax=virus sp. ctyMK1 TaxID=2828002 RepID=A0A8S5REC5_9VIRU|nr:MAG TPA: ERF superfamily protein [virus sp. ctyMK1]